MYQVQVLLIASENAEALPIEKFLSGPSIKFLGTKYLKDLLKEHPPKHHPDVILVPEAIGKPSLLESISRIKSLFSRTKVLVLGKHNKEEIVMEAISMGCAGYLAPPIQRDDLMEAIQLCNEGLIWAPRRVLSKLIHNFRAQCNGLDQLDKIQPRITPREGDVLRFLVKGWTNKEIAQALSVDEITVKVHISHLLRKLDLKNRCQLISHLIYRHWEG